MRWSWRIARLAGIDVYLHATFLLLLGVFVVPPILYGVLRTGTPGARPAGDYLLVAAGELLYVCTIFGIVVLHELGHALAARRYGIRTRDIILLPIGGVARLERMPEEPIQELIVALAGPAVNVVLAVIAFATLIPVAGLGALGEWSFISGSILQRLFVINVILALFNLLPAFPMDGGRVLRALLAIKLDYVQATHIAATVGQGMAFLLGFLGLVTQQYMLIFVALFVWMGAAEEASVVQMKSALGGIPISRAMITDFRTLSENEPLGNAVAHILAGFQQDFPVLENGQLVGVLTRNDLMTGLTQRGAQTPVGEVMKRQFATADPSEMLNHVFARLQECECHTLPVVRNGQLVGIVTMENLGEFMMIQSALRKVRT
ncbi:MAG: site-2 protease family protein [Candidatus Hydrogenedentes bacterium]|nr:site-2 protease family protein [Candidatus Hydrogenedentota bacterium]